MMKCKFPRCKKEFNCSYSMVRIINVDTCENNFYCKIHALSILKNKYGYKFKKDIAVGVLRSETKEIHRLDLLPRILENYAKLPIADRFNLLIGGRKQNR